MNIVKLHDIGWVIKDAAKHLHDFGVEYTSEKWQGKPTEAMHKMLSVDHYSFAVPIPETREDLMKLTGAQQPWSEDHFQERVCGEPLNPGNEYKNWKFYKHNPKNDQFRTEGEKFTHTYMERFWPKYAGEAQHGDRELHDMINRGISYDYGDLNDVVELLKKEPLTRQAYFPIWFPEDTGASHGGRVPCTLGYHFQIREGKMNITYYIRAVDFFRHFRDDIYLACRLLEWVIEKTGLEVDKGRLIMHIADFHCFAHEKNMLKRTFNR